MSPYAAVLLVALGGLLLVLCLKAFAGVRPISLSPTHLVLYAVFGVATVGLFWGPWIDGLEYEDAFIHKAFARGLAASNFSQTEGFFVEVCIVGNFHDCYSRATFGTQLIGLGVIDAVVVWLFGPHEWTTNYASAGATLLSLLLVDQLAIRGGASIHGRFCALLCAILCPGFFVIGASSFAEPVFVFFILLQIFAYYKIDDLRALRMDLGWICIFLFASILLVCIKKEALTVILVEIVWSLAGVVRSRQMTIRSSLVILSLLSIAAFSVFAVGLVEAASRHSSDIKAPAFSLSYVWKLAPVVLKAMFDPQHFGVGFAVAAGLGVAGLLMGKRESLKFGFLLGAFFAVYSLHARHQFFAAGQGVEPVEMVRYIFVMVPFASLAAAYGADAIFEIARRSSASSLSRSVLPAQTAIGILSAITILFAIQDRTAQEMDEKRGRLGPLFMERQSRVIITPFPVAVLARGPNDIIVIDSFELKQPEIRAYLEQVKANSLVAVDASLCKDESTLIAPLCRPR